MAVISYDYVLLAEGSEAALAQHVLWGFMLMTIAVFGNGSLAVDRLWSKRPDKQPLAVASRPA